MGSVGMLLWGWYCGDGIAGMALRGSQDLASARALGVSLQQGRDESVRQAAHVSVRVCLARDVWDGVCVCDFEMVESQSLVFVWWCDVGLLSCG